MNVEQLVAGMTPEIFANLQTAVETGKWANGQSLTDEQKENALQAVMLYQAKIAKTNEHMTIGENGEMVHKSKSELRRELSEESEIFRTKL
ncbi:DUF1315 family protein [Alteromonas sp. LMIT006]|jgi:uncharacterized protein|uniref:YeaC family protein n=1 Tax=Alteromonadaceae TaxID=72275 RepID=UPI0020CA45FA|nr:DUF1315 family protein [Alteromonas sp. LMIT006]UTP72413.1 DUF1315 family protein [Alteromonas sp. LMIT006]